jgi:ABC-type dipeptide/oligopeptide/nickel transport system permease subunit
VVLSAEAMRAFPTLLLVLLFAAVGLPASLLLAVYFWIPIWRTLRSELVTQQRQPYVLSARLLGLSRLRVLIQDVVPNVAPRALPYAAGLMSEIISAQCAVEFLGFGPPLEQASLGGLLLEASHLGLRAPWVWAPSLVTITLLVFAIAWTVCRYRQTIRWVPVG